MNYLKHIARIIIGITFIFSGFVKGIDPMGSVYKFTDYYHAMGMEWFNWSSLPLGFIIPFAEFAIGIALFFNVFTRFFSLMALLFMGFFLPFTLWIAIKNPVTDCGCFGDALVISNWETFYKNIILSACAIIVFIYRKKMNFKWGEKPGYWLAGITTLSYVAIVFYSYNHLPIIDFRPYKEGVNIPESMKFPEGAPKDVYENVFYYKNKATGKVEKFTEQNYPWQDTVNWVYDRMESKLVKPGYIPPIHDFSIQSSQGEDVTDFFLYDKNYVLMLIAHNLEKSSLKPQEKINTLANWAKENNIMFVCLTSTLPDQAAEFAKKTRAPYEFFNCDEIALKTMIRSNPGLTLIKNGTILKHWHYNDIPTPEDFKKKYPIQ